MRVSPFVSIFRCSLILPLVMVVTGTLASPVWAAQPCIPLEKRVYVKSLADFVILMESHIERHTTIGMDIPQRFQRLYGNIDPSLLRQLLELHDKPKLQNWDRPGSIASRLYEFYGCDVEKMTGEQKEKFKAVIRDLNDEETRTTTKFLEANKLIATDGKPTKMGSDLLEIDKASDQFDRVMAPTSTEEWNKTMEPVTTSEWFNIPRVKTIAPFYEGVSFDRNGQAKIDHSVYDHLTRKNEYSLFRKRRLTTLCLLRGLAADTALSQTNPH